MSCAAEPMVFRLLDGIVGWDPLDYTGLEGLDDIIDGVALARLSPNAIDPAQLLPWLPPARIAQGCGKCAWYLVTPVPSRLLRLECGVTPPPCSDPYPCNRAFVSIDCMPDLRDAVAVAARRHLVAVSDKGAHEVRIFGASGAELLAVIPMAEPGALAFSPHGGLYVAAGGTTTRVLHFSPAGDELGAWRAPFPVAGGLVDRMAFAKDGALWLVVAAPDKSLSLWRSPRDQSAFVRAEIRDLAKNFEPTTLVMASDRGFSLRDGVQGPTCCFDEYGHPIACPPPPPPIARAKQGQLLTLPIDSGRPRCRWHRVRLEANVPAGTSLSVAVATSESATPVSQGDATQETGWETFPAGVPHPTDWDAAPRSSLDYLIRQPPGRYLHLRLRLSGDGAATPVVHRIRIDLPRTTSLERLPPVYREEPRAEEFTERFLSLYDASIESLDEAIERFPALLDGGAAPEGVLPWLGSFLDVAFETSWTAERRRALLAATPALYRRRGTKQGLIAAIQKVLGVEPVIQELAFESAWGALSKTAQLGSVRLFGRARARFTLGSSALCKAPMRSFGDPALDPLTGSAWRLRVLIPGVGSPPQVMRERLTRLLDSQKPAHTVVTTRVGGTGFIVGSWSTAGVDTVLAPLPAPVLGGPKSNARLSRATVLWTRRGGARGRFSVGSTAAVGIHTLTN
ncbi:MAG TPA: phage tail protein [Kofleriaceae bacterium]|jgi:phage tail-like protein